jgi:hypothetical protein
MSHSCPHMPGHCDVITPPLYRKGQLTASQVRTYDLEEKEQYGRKLLYLLPLVVKLIFDVNGCFGVKRYTDPKLWGDSGPMYDKEQRVDLTSLEMTIKEGLEGLVLQGLPCRRQQWA